MSGSASAIYCGEVMHHRVRPCRHRFRYRVFSLLVDLDEVEALHRRLRLLSCNRYNVLSFFERDHGPGDGTPLRGWVEEQLAVAGLSRSPATIRLLCYPRLLGYVFNPLAVYFCYDHDGGAVAILYQVSNTFGQRHTYLIPVDSDASGPVRQQCEKAFYVSPFNDVVGSYRFTVDLPAETVKLVIHQRDATGPFFHASFAGHRREIDDSTLFRALLSYPLMTLKVIAGIHWEALRLWRKGMRIIPRPAPPPDPVTVVAPMAAGGAMDRGTRL